MDDRLFEFTEFVGRWDSLIDSLIVDLEYESPSGVKFRAALLEKIIETETIASEFRGCLGGRHSGTAQDRISSGTEA
jgi:hypothetical protein